MLSHPCVVLFRAFAQGSVAAQAATIIYAAHASLSEWKYHVYLCLCSALRQIFWRQSAGSLWCSTQWVLSTSKAAMELFCYVFPFHFVLKLHLSYSHLRQNLPRLLLSFFSLVWIVCCDAE